MIKKALLIRLCETNGATLGQFVINDFPFFATLELEWNDNKRDASCIPAGKYVCEYRENVTLRNGYVVDRTYEIVDVPDRSGIYFHVGNYPRNTLGCPLLGMSYGMNDKTPCIWESQKAFDKFLVLTDLADAFPLTVINAL